MCKSTFQCISIRCTKIFSTFEYGFFFRDEPTVGIDPVNGNIIWNHLKKLSVTNSTTILVTTHSMNEAERSDKVGFMRRGKVLVESSPQALLAKYSVKTLDEVFYAVSLEDEKSNAVSRTVCQDNLFGKFFFY